MAEYQVLDIREPYPFSQRTFDLILATMVFNEITVGGLRVALSECRRVLKNRGQLIATVAHPVFVRSLSKRKVLRRKPKGMLTMPGSGSLRLPIVPRSAEKYVGLCEQYGFDCRTEDVSATEKVLNRKPGLRKTGKVPIALLLNCFNKL